jgi:hypothetical protein
LSFCAIAPHGVQALARQRAVGRERGIAHRFARARRGLASLEALELGGQHLDLAVKPRLLGVRLLDGLGRGGPFAAQGLEVGGPALEGLARSPVGVHEARRVLGHLVAGHEARRRDGQPLLDVRQGQVLALDTRRQAAHVTLGLGHRTAQRLRGHLGADHVLGVGVDLRARLGQLGLERHVLGQRSAHGAACTLPGALEHIAAHEGDEAGTDQGDPEELAEHGIS